MKKLMSLFFMLCVGIAPVFSQTNTGRLVGTVASTDGVIAGATVTVTDDKTKRDRTVVTSGDGSLSCPNWRSAPTR